MVKNLPAMQEIQEAWVRFLGREDPLEEDGIPLQHSCLENPMDRGAWWATRPQGHKESDTTEVTEHTCTWFLVQSLVSLTSKSHL